MMLSFSCSTHILGFTFKMLIVGLGFALYFMKLLTCILVLSMTADIMGNILKTYRASKKLIRITTCHLFMRNLSRMKKILTCFKENE